MLSAALAPDARADGSTRRAMVMVSAGEGVTDREAAELEMHLWPTFAPQRLRPRAARFLPRRDDGAGNSQGRAARAGQLAVEHRDDRRDAQARREAGLDGGAFPIPTHRPEPRQPRLKDSAQVAVLGFRHRKQLSAKDARYLSDVIRAAGL